MSSPELRAVLREVGVDPDAGLAVLVPPKAAAPPAPAPVDRVAVQAARLVGLQLVGDVVGIGAWVVLGASGARIDPGRFCAWALLVLTAVAIRVWASAGASELGVTTGALLRRRLLLGALGRSADDARREGIGDALARANEAQRLESFGLGVGAGAVIAAGEVLLAATALLAHAPLLAAALLGVLGIGAIRVRLLAKAAGTATTARTTLTSVLTEELLGHRTRLVQEPESRRHVHELPALRAHADAQAEVDRVALGLHPTLARLWLAGGLLLAVLLPGTDLGTIGAIVLAWRGLERLASASAEGVAVGVAWRALRPLWSAPDPPLGTATPGDGELRARGLAFGWASGAPVLHDAELRVRPGERVLVEGPSGAGKSTLALLLAGLIRPTRGLLLAGGLDLPTLGAGGWRRRVVAAPQFHQNHVFYGSFAFNLLAGRAWPPSWEDLGAARGLCQELGLGPLLERMPGGLFEVVGETGWQLSHGERSRLFLARALLQGAPVVVLDESFGALDPATLASCVEVARRRAGTLVVVAHP